MTNIFQFWRVFSGLRDISPRARPHDAAKRRQRANHQNENRHDQLDLLVLLQRDQSIKAFLSRQTNAHPSDRTQRGPVT